jgi:vacuolar-type H+-ATPase subunit H
VNSKILKLIEQRLLIGERKYGHQNVVNDGRNFLKESLEEALDCAVYLAARLIELDEKEIDKEKDKINC